MGVETKGWIGGDSSMADAMFESMWGVKKASLPPPGRITEGPLADFRDGYDPVAAQRELQNQHRVEFHEKVGRVVGGDNNFDSPTSPGGNRVVQQDTAAGHQTNVVQTPESAKSGPRVEDTKKDSAPSKGSKGGDLARRLKAKRSASDSETQETATKSDGERGESKGPGHNLQVKEAPPVPKEMDPERAPGNLPDNTQTSSWTGSGPQAALHYDHQKVGGLADQKMIQGLLNLAGVPPSPLPDTCLLMRKAANVAVMNKEASGVEYFTRPDVHPLKLVAELGDSLGDDWTEWEPETIRETLIKEAGIEPSDDVMSKIMAVKIVLARPEVFFDSWVAMEKISVALNDQAPAMGIVEDVPVEWLSNAVTIVQKLAGDGDFTPETTKYVAARLFDQGYVVAPPLLRFADDELGEKVANDALRKKVILAYAKALKAEDAPDGEDVVSVQVTRLLRNHAYVLDKLDESMAQMQ